jgi:NAD(P)-dependent dehydrogenase (short-subunit alcohol dehydrogenase family)
MTRTFVSELGETGLTVLSMHPGWVKTDMGGDQAPLDVQTSADGMVEQVTLALGRGGHHYLDYKGDQLPW